MEQFDVWTHDFSEMVDGLNYDFPFEIGDYVVASFKSQSTELEEITNRYIMKVIQVGVPIQNDLDTIVEGVRVQLLKHVGDVYEDAGHGYKENIPVAMLRKVDRPLNLITEQRLVV